MLPSFFMKKGARIVCISSTSGALHDPAGIDINELLELKKKFRGAAVKEYSGGKLLPVEDELTLDVDIVIPAAKGDVITGDNVNAVKAKIIVEGANFPTTAAVSSIIRRNVGMILDEA